MLKTCRLSRVYILAKGDKDVTSAYCSKRRIRMRACHAHVLNPHLLFFSLSPVSLSLERFLGTSATDDFDLFNLCLVYILIMYGVLLVPSPVTLVVDLREIEGRTPLELTHAVAAEVAIAAANAPNVSVATTEVARRQGPPISICSIFL